MKERHAVVGVQPSRPQVFSPNKARKGKQENSVIEFESARVFPP